MTEELTAENDKTLHIDKMKIYNITLAMDVETRFRKILYKSISIYNI